MGTNTGECSVQLGVPGNLGLEQKERGRTAQVGTQGRPAEPVAHGKAAERPPCVPADALGSFSAGVDRINVVLRGSGWTGARRGSTRGPGKLQQAPRGERRELGLEGGGRDRERWSALKGQG